MSLLASRLLITAILLGLLWWGRELLAPLCLAGFVALALAPLTGALARWVHRGVAAFIVVVAFLGVLAGTGYALADDAARAIEEMPQTVRRVRLTIERSADSRQGVVGSIARAVDEVQGFWDARAASGAPPDLRRGLLVLSTRAAAVSTQAIALTFLIFFLLATGDSLKAKVVRLAGAGFTRRRITIKAVDDIIAQVGYFVVYLIVSGLLVGVTTWLAFWWLGVAHAPLWGMAAGLLNAVPYLGPAIILISATAASLVQFEAIGPAATVGGVSLAITSFEGLVLTPLLFSRLTHIHPVGIFLSIMFWSWIWGPIGTFLAVPLVTAANTLLKLLPHPTATSEWLADGTGSADADESNAGTAAGPGLTLQSSGGPPSAAPR